MFAFEVPHGGGCNHPLVDSGYRTWPGNVTGTTGHTTAVPPVLTN